MRFGKILILAATLAHGGEAKAILSLTSGLVKRGWKVAILTFDPVVPEGLPGELLVEYAGVTRASRAAGPIIKCMLKIRPDVVVTASGQFSLLGILLCGAPFFDAQVFVTEHSVQGWDSRRRVTPQSLLTHFGAMIYYRFADHLVAISPAVAYEVRSFLRIPGSRVEMIGNLVFNTELLEKAKARPRHLWLCEKTGPVVVALGHLIEPKGFDILIRAFKDVAEKTGARLIVFGEGPSRGKLEKLIRDLGLTERVSLPGAIKNPHAEVARADLLVSASYFESLSLAVAEALCLNVPVVAAAARGGLPDLLGGGHYGCLVQVGNPAAMAEAIQQVLAAPRTSTPREAVQWLSEEHVLGKWERAIEQATCVRII